MNIAAVFIVCFGIKETLFHRETLVREQDNIMFSLMYVCLYILCFVFLYYICAVSRGNMEWNICPALFNTTGTTVNQR